MTETSSKPTVLHFPLEGICVARRPPRHHPLALDLMGLSDPDGRTSTAGRLRWLVGGVDTTRFHGWNRTIHGPARGEVVAVGDGIEDRARTGALRTVAIWAYATFFFRPSMTDEGEPDIGPNVGNHIMVELETGNVAFYAHLRNGSSRVAVGDRVEAETVLGAVGNSGNTTAPHLHVHVLDQMSDLLTAQLVPFVFSEYERWNGTAWETEVETIPEPGQVVRPAQAADPRPRSSR